MKPDPNFNDQGNDRNDPYGTKDSNSDSDSAGIKNPYIGMRVESVLPDSPGDGRGTIIHLHGDLVDVKFDCCSNTQRIRLDDLVALDPIYDIERPVSAACPGPIIPPQIGMRVKHALIHGIGEGVIKRIIGNMPPQGNLVVLVKFDNSDRLEPVDYNNLKVIEPEKSRFYNQLNEVGFMDGMQKSIDRMMHEILRRRELIFAAIVNYNSHATDAGAEVVAIDFRTGTDTYTRYFIENAQAKSRAEAELHLHPDLLNELKHLGRTFRDRYFCVPLSLTGRQIGDELSSMMRRSDGSLDWPASRGPKEFTMPPELKHALWPDKFNPLPDHVCRHCFPNGDCELIYPNSNPRGRGCTGRIDCDEFLPPIG